MLCDISKVHTGYGFIPKVSHCTDDENWGKPGFSKKVFVSKSLTQKGGFSSYDNIIERIENQYWKIELNQFQNPMFGFSKFTGEWRTTEIEEYKIRIDYTYTLHSDHFLLYPFNWLFTMIIWRKYMKQVLNNIRQMTIVKEPYMFD